MRLFAWVKKLCRVNPKKKSQAVKAVKCEAEHSPDKPKRAGLSVSWESANGLYTLVQVDGVLNETSTSLFEDKLEKCISSGQIRLLLNLRNLSYVSSRGWGILISLLQRLRQLGGDIKIVGMQTNVRHVFKNAGLENIIESYENIAQAHAAFE